MLTGAPPRRKTRTPSRVEVVLHPVRLKIVLALQNQERTTREIQEQLGDIPQATLYRHINRLIQSGVVRVVEHRQERGTMERTLALVREQTRFTPEEFAALPPEDLARVFAIFLGGLQEVFSRYIYHSQPDLLRDHVTFYAEMVYLTEEEAARVREEMGRLIRQHTDNAAEPGRRRRLLAVFSLPDASKDNNLSEESDKSKCNDPGERA